MLPWLPKDFHSVYTLYTVKEVRLWLPSEAISLTSDPRSIFAVCLNKRYQFPPRGGNEIWKPLPEIRSRE
jgi:hypothetical protein